MNTIGHLYTTQQPLTKQGIALCIGVISVAAIVLAIIGLTAGHGSFFKSIVQFGIKNNAIFLGIGISSFFTDIIWIIALNKKKAGIKYPLGQRFDFIDRVPRSVNQEIFSHLDPESLITCLDVSQKWRSAIINNTVLKQKILTFIAHGKEKWEAHFGQVGEESALPEDILQTLCAPCPFWEGKKVWQTHMLLLIPETLNNKQLTFERLTDSARNIYKYWFFPPIREKFGNTTADKSHWILITRDFIAESVNKEHEELKKRVKEKGYELPSMIEAMIYVLVQQAISKEKEARFSMFKKTEALTCCKEEIEGIQVAVGDIRDFGICYTKYSPGRPGIQFGAIAAKAL